MKRMILVLALILAIVAAMPAQNLQGLGRDFEVVIESLGESLLPGLEQSAIWGQYPGMATYAGTTNFFMSQSFGAVFTPGILGFVGDTDAFTVLNVPDLIQGALDQTQNATISNLYTGLQTFFPIPIVRTGMGFVLPGDVELMVSAGGFPQFITGFATGLAGVEGIELGMAHFGGKVRTALLQDVGPFPAISLGGGYTYQGVTIGYNLTQADGSPTENQIEGVGNLYFSGNLEVKSRVHTFGLDLQTSKRLGFFVPYLGISPYFHLASFGGSVGADGDNEFDAYIDYTPADGIVDRDVQYDLDAYGIPSTALLDYNMSLVLYGGFDLLLGGFAIQIGGSWSVAKGSPAASLTFRLQ